MTQDRAIELLNNLCKEVLGKGLTHFPEGEVFREMWQYDGDLEGVLVQVTKYTSCAGLPALDVAVDYPDGTGESFRGHTNNWYGEWNDDFKRAVARTTLE